MSRFRIIFILFASLFVIGDFVNCTGSFSANNSLQSALGGQTIPTPTPGITPTPTPLPQACEQLDPMPTPTQFGSRWNPAAYAFMSQQLDTALQRADFLNDQSGTLAVTRSFQMPFLTTQNSPGCQTFQAQVLMPNPSLNKVTQAISCPTAPYTDVSAQVSSALASLASTQVSDAAKGIQDSLELDFQTPCTYYFLSSGAGSFISIPKVNDLIMSGGTSLQDAATLIFANPVEVSAANFSSDVFLETTPTGTNSTFQTAFSNNVGGQRIQIRNFNIRGYTPPVINGVVQWSLHFPYVDFGTISADPNNPGQNLLTVTTNNPGGQIYYDTNIRQIVEADPAAPQKILTNAPTAEVDGGGLATVSYAGTGQALVMSSTSFAKLAAGPVKIFHDTGQSHASFVFLFSEPDDADPINDISLVNINLTDYSAISLAIGMTKGLLLENFHITPSGQNLQTVTGGGLILGQLLSDLIVENSEFSYGGDDDMNLRSTLANISSAPTFDGTNTSFSVSGSFNQQNGTPLCFLSPTFDMELCANLLSYDAKTNTFTLGGDQTSLIQNGDFIYRSDRPNARIYIVNNLFQGNRSHGILMKGSNAYIANNQFIGTQGPGIMISPGATAEFTEGPLSRNVIVANNTLNDNEAGLAYGAIGTAIDVGKVPVASQSLQNILIEGNSIGNQISPAVFTASSGFVDVRNNTYGNVNLTQYATGKFWVNAGTGFTLAPICSINP